MNGRDEFMLLARINYLEFSSLRRASFSTLCLLCQITNEMNGFQLFVHASKCHDKQCNLKLCKMLKAAVEHAFRCLDRFTGKCLVCKKLTSMYCYHAKYCTDEKCTVPFCSGVKEQLKKRSLNER